MPLDIRFTRSAVDVVNMANSAIRSGSAKDQTDWSRELMQNSGALEYLAQRMQNGITTDTELMGRILAIRCIEIIDECIKDRKPLFFLDMFRDRGLFRQIQPGRMTFMQQIMDYAAGEVRVLGDKVDDLPTTGGRSKETKIKKAKYVGKSVEYGLFEQWEASCEGRDLLAERLRDAMVDFDEFFNWFIANGMPLHDLYGLQGNPDIPTKTVVASADNAPATDWPNKTPEEILYDLNVMADVAYAGSNCNVRPDTILLSMLRYRYLSTTLMGTQATPVLKQHLADVECAGLGGLTNFIPFEPYDQAGPGDTPIAMVGSFDRGTIELPIMAPMQLAPMYHGLHWKIPLIGAVGSVCVKKEGRYYEWQGI